VLRTLLVSVTAALLFTTAVRAADKPLSAAAQVAQMKRGVNIVGYDPLWRDASQARFKPRHFKIIKDGGFDHVRFNLACPAEVNSSAISGPGQPYS